MITPSNQNKNNKISGFDVKSNQKKTYRIKSGYKKNNSPPKNVFRQNGERIVVGQDNVSKNQHVVQSVRGASRKKSVSSKHTPNNYQKKYQQPSQYVSNK